MPKFKYWKNKIIIILVLLAVLVFSILKFALPSRKITQIEPEQTLQSRVTNDQSSQDAQKVVVATNPSADYLEFKNDTTENISVYDLMQKLRSTGKFDFTEKNYTGMGEFITSINGLKNSTNKNWIYYVNSKKAEIGVSNHELKPGDVVSWKYENNY